MEVIKFLKANGNNFQKLTDVYGIKVKDYPEQKLVVLNYDQINSPKMEPIVQECRGIILDYALNVVCRPFDRFFNYGEAETDKMDLTEYTYFPKLDGSLIKVYYWNNSWRIATRGTGFVGYDKEGIPRVKVKSAAYVAIHHIRGEGLNPKRIAELVISGEEEEYLTYFPEDRDTITPYSVALEGLLTKLIDAMMTYQTVEDQKEFALANQGCAREVCVVYSTKVQYFCTRSFSTWYNKFQGRNATELNEVT